MKQASTGKPNYPLRVGIALIAVFLVAVGCSSRMRAGIYSSILQDNGQFTPFEMAPGVYYVGSSDIAVFAIKSGEHIAIIDGGYQSTANQVLRNLKTLGFDPLKVEYILNTHAHMDHAAGIAKLKSKMTNAKVVASENGAAQLKIGGRKDFFLGDWMTYPPVEAGKVVEPGKNTVDVGALTITAVFTPGHTMGCTSWTFPLQVDGHEVAAFVNCSTSTLIYKLTNNKKYPHIAEDFAGTFDLLRDQPCDFFLGAHGHFFNLKAKRNLQIVRPVPNPFVDPEGCKAFNEHSREEFFRRLGKAEPQREKPAP